MSENASKYYNNHFDINLFTFIIKKMATQIMCVEQKIKLTSYLKVIFRLDSVGSVLMSFLGCGHSSWRRPGLGGNFLTYIYTRKLDNTQSARPCRPCDQVWACPPGADPDPLAGPGSPGRVSGHGWRAEGRHVVEAGPSLCWSRSSFWAFLALRGDRLCRLESRDGGGLLGSVMGRVLF